MTTNSNLYIEQGTDYRVRINIVSSDPAFDLADYDFASSARKLYSANASITASFTKFPLSNTNPINSVEMYISANSTIDVDPGKYFYDVVIQNVNTDEIEKILEGLMFIEQTVTRI